MNNFSKDITNMEKEFDLILKITTSSLKISKKLITRKQNSFHMLKTCIEDEIKNKNRSTILKLLVIEIEKKYGINKKPGAQQKNKNAIGSPGPKGRSNAKKSADQVKNRHIPNTKITEKFHTDIENFLKNNPEFTKSKLVRKGIETIIYQRE